MAAQVGPKYYDTDGVRAVLAVPGGDPVAEHEVELLRNWHAIVALPTEEGHFIYPTWQFRDHDVLPGLTDVLAAFHSPLNRRAGSDPSRSPRPDAVAAAGPPTAAEPWSPWSVATWITTPLEDLGGVSVVEWLLEGRELDQVVQLGRRTAAAWAV